jgi:hypothetical protein
MSNAVITVDPSWIERAHPATIVGVKTKVLVPEELLASKLFVGTGRFVQRMPGTASENQRHAGLMSLIVLRSFFVGGSTADENSSHRRFALRALKPSHFARSTQQGAR